VPEDTHCVRSKNIRVTLELDEGDPRQWKIIYMYTQISTTYIVKFRFLLLELQSASLIRIIA
jgi:hypothetical protein